MSIKTLEGKVREILEYNPKARDDDRLLTLEVWTTFYRVNPYAPVSEIMKNKHLPSQESVGRARRKLQELDESLRGSKQKEKIRMERQVEFLQYARGE